MSKSEIGVRELHRWRLSTPGDGMKRFHIVGNFHAHNIDDAIARLAAHFSGLHKKTGGRDAELDGPRIFSVYPIDEHGEPVEDQHPGELGDVEE